MLKKNNIIQSPTKPIYYNWNRAFSFNATFNVIITERNLGKSYGMVIKMLRAFVFKGYKSIWNTRNKYEVEPPIKKSYQMAIYKTIEEILYNRTDPKLNDRIKKIEIDDRNILINGKIAFTFYALSEAELAKKNPMLKQYRFMIFDEFITFGRYITNEVDKFYTMYGTINRRRTGNDRCRAFLMANPITAYNPYTNEMQLDVKKYGFTYLPERDLLIHVSNNKAFQKQFEENPIDKLTKGINSKYYEMASKGQFVYDNDDFVCETLEVFKAHHFMLLINDKFITFSELTNSTGYYLHTKKKATRLFHNKKPHKESVPLGKERLSNLKTVYNNAMIYYENIDIKRNFEKEYMGRVV